MHSLVLSCTVYLKRVFNIKRSLEILYWAVQEYRLIRSCLVTICLEHVFFSQCSSYIMYVYRIVLVFWSHPTLETGKHLELNFYSWRKGLGSIRGVFGPMSKISLTLSNYRFVIRDKNYRRYFVI